MEHVKFFLCLLPCASVITILGVFGLFTLAPALFIFFYGAFVLFFAGFLIWATCFGGDQ